MYKNDYFKQHCKQSVSTLCSRLMMPSDIILAYASETARVCAKCLSTQAWCSPLFRIHLCNRCLDTKAEFVTLTLEQTAMMALRPAEVKAQLRAYRVNNQIRYLLSDVRLLAMGLYDKPHVDLMAANFTMPNPFVDEQPEVIDLAEGEGSLQQAEEGHPELFWPLDEDGLHEALTSFFSGTLTHPLYHSYPPYPSCLIALSFTLTYYLHSLFT